jgi:predicted nucleic-acid-binding protein
MAAEVMRSGDFFVCKTVMPELERVLRCAYGFDRETIHGANLRLLGLSALQVEDEDAVAEALRGYEAGLDFADALHRSPSVPTLGEFATFVQALATKAPRGEGALRVHLLEARPDASRR